LGLAASSSKWQLPGLPIGVSPRFYGGFDGQWSRGWGLSGYLGFGATLKYQSPPFYWPGTPFYGKLGASLDQAFEAHLVYGGDGIDIIGEFPGGVMIELTGGVGLANLTCFEVFVGGGPYWVFKCRDEELRLKEWGAKVRGGIRWQVLLYRRELAVEHTWTAAGTMSGQAPFELVKATMPPVESFTLMPRNYLVGSTPYCTFIAGESRTPKFWGDPVSRGVPLVLQTNVFPYSEPALAVSGTNRVLLLITDNTNRAPENRTEVVWSKWNGTTWLNPTSVWDDATADFSPAVRVFADGSALAAWENEKVVLTNGAALDVALAGLEIASAKLDPVSGLWTAANLTSNDYLDRSPQLGAAANGRALLTWIQNTNSSLFGTTNALNVVESRLWDGANWQNTGTIGPDPGMLLWSTVAYDGSNGVFLAVIDPDDDQSTTGDQELWGATFDGVGWTSLARLTTNAVQDTKPQAAYDSSGRLLVVWYQNTNIVMRVGDLDLGNPMVVGVLSGASSQKDFHLVTGLGGQVSMVWEDLAADGSGPDPMVLNYDPALGVWGQPVRLLSNTDQLERSFSGAYTDEGNLLLAYNRVAVTYETNSVPQFGAVDLMFLDYSIGGDLGVQSGDINLSTHNPAPGESVTVSALVRNLGELGATNVQVAFYDGNPTSGGLLIGSTQTVAGVVVAGSNAVVEVPWTVPQTTTNRTLYVLVDPALAQADRNRANNTAVKSVLAAELEISEMTVLEPSATNRIVTARVVNTGVIPSGASVDVVFRRCTTNGPVLAAVPIASVPTNGAYDATFDWNLAGLVFTNAYELVYAAVDPANAVAEADEGNNVRVVQVMTALDSDGDGLLDGEELRYGTNPNLADSDNDGLTDSEEVRTFHTDPTKWDTDGDGVSDKQEILAGTDPNSGASLFKVLSVVRNLDGSVVLEWSSVSNRVYTVKRALTPLRTGAVTLTNNVAPTAPTNSFTDTTATNATSFYWIEAE
jgi:hypothetical protein